MQKTRYIPHHATNCQDLLGELLTSSIVLPEEWESLSPQVRQEILKNTDTETFLDQMMKNNLLTSYQVARIRAGTTFGLILGNYRVLERLGAGGMAVVFKAEHRELRHLAAIKVLPLSPEQDHRLQTRFSTEMRIVARLHHPNIVAAMDCGRAENGDPNTPVLWYLVMEYVAGNDLEELVQANGPLPPARACNLIHQIACALAEIHKFNLVHRDIKPSNILATYEDQAKLLDFGLSRQIETRMTTPGTVLGTIDFMAPEQARDASAVDIRADIYGLGGTLFWCLTGQLPFPGKGNPTQNLADRLTQSPPSVRKHLPELSPRLDEVIARMMAVKPQDRYPTPQAVMQSLLAFLKPDSCILSTRALSPSSGENTLPQINGVENPPRLFRILIVDDEVSISQFARAVLQGEGWACDEATNGLEAIQMLTQKPYDLMLLDVNMPGMSGTEVLRTVRSCPPCPHFKIIMYSGAFSTDELAQLLGDGADDYLLKPFSLVRLQRKVQAALRLKEAQDRSDLLTKHLLTINAELERNLNLRNSDLTQTRNALVLTLAKLVARRDSEASTHLHRMQRYCRFLAMEAAKAQTFANQIDENFIEMLECCAPLHDIGKVGLPDHILLKPGKLTPEERIVMQAHTIIGADTLKNVAESHGLALAFLQMAIDITRHHHEKFDGTGYPDRLEGNGIPLAARIVAICDVYDALRARRTYKPALSHTASLQMMTQVLEGHFDPALLQVFLRCEPSFDSIRRELPDSVT